MKDRNQKGIPKYMTKAVNRVNKIDTFTSPNISLPLQKGMMQ